MKKAYGFTVVELAVVIAVIGILSAVTLVSYRSIQIQARDNAIKTAVAQAADALKLRASQKNERVNVPGTGDGSIAGNTTAGTGQGWFQSGTYANPIEDRLISEGFLPPDFSKELKSSTVSNNGRILMFYLCENGRSAVYASLNENSGKNDAIATAQRYNCYPTNPSTPFNSYNMNYIRVF